MSVQVGWNLRIFIEILCFNTSYVSVQVARATISSLLLPVSIHPMCRFKPPTSPVGVPPESVSIHPMCRFKKRPNDSHQRDNRVSVHPMCRFKTVAAPIKIAVD